METKNSSWKPHFSQLSKANQPITSAPPGGYKNVSSDEAAAKSPLAWQAPDLRGWKSKFDFCRKGHPCWEGWWEKGAWTARGGRRFGAFGTQPQHTHEIWVPPGVPPPPGQNPAPVSHPAGINIWIFPAFLWTLAIYTIFRFFMRKSKKCSAPEMAELRAFALNTVLTAKGRGAQRVLTKGLLMMRGKRNDIVGSAGFLPGKAPVLMLAHISHLSRSPLFAVIKQIFVRSPHSELPRAQGRDFSAASLMCQRRLQEFRAENGRSGLGGKGKGSEEFKSNLRQGLAQSAGPWASFGVSEGGTARFGGTSQAQFPLDVNQKGIESADFCLIL